MADGVHLKVDGMEALRKGLAESQRHVAKAQRLALKKVGEEVAAWSRAAARSGERIERRFASNIRGSATQRFARIQVHPGRSGRGGGAAVAFFGARPLTRTGWNASTYDRNGNRLGGRRRLPGARPQHRPWVGRNWIAGRRGEGPYVINDVLANRANDIDRMIADAYTSALDESLGG